MIALAIALGSSPAWAEDPQEESVEERVESPRERLDAALRAYAEGRLVESRNILLVLVSDPEILDEDLLLEARLWLGEVQYMLGERDAARSSFETVLLYDPDLRMDTFAHPPEVVVFFESVRASVRVRPPDVIEPPDLDPDPPQPPKLRAWLTPGGLQTYNGRPLLGSAVLLTVGGSALFTGAARLYLFSADIHSGEYGINPSSEEQARNLMVLRGFQVAIGTAGLVTWSSSLVVGGINARRNYRIAVEAWPGGVSVRW